MQVLRSALVIGFALALASSSARGADDKAEGAGKKLEWKAGSGSAATFVVRRTATTEGESPRGSFKQEETGEIEYRVEVADRAESGDVTLKVSYKSMKVKQEGQTSWEFDSAAPKTDDDEAAAYLREAAASTMTVKVSGGRITEVTGFPEIPRSDDGDRRAAFRRMRGRTIAGRGALTRDLALILSLPVEGQTLEKGKEYRQEPADAESGGGDAPGGRRRGRGGAWYARLAPPLTYKFEGVETVGDTSAAKFSLALDRPARRADGNEGGRRGNPFGSREEKVEGTALVSMEDGGLLRLVIESERESRGERDGQSFSFTRRSRTVVERAAGGKKAPAVKL